MKKATYEESMLMLQLAQLAVSMGYGEASNWMWSDEFVPSYAEFGQKYPAGSEGALRLRTILNYFESIGTLYKHGALDDDLLFDWLAVAPVWDRVKGLALGMREESGNARFYENFEAMAKADVAYSTKSAKRAAKKSKK